MQEFPTLTDLRVFYLRVDASVACVYVCNRSHRSKIFHDSGAQNGRGLIEVRGIQIDFKWYRNFEKMLESSKAG